jgi:hypothetical protein
LLLLLVPIIQFRELFSGENVESGEKRGKNRAQKARKDTTLHAFFSKKLHDLHKDNALNKDSGNSMAHPIIFIENRLQSPSINQVSRVE